MQIPRQLYNEGGISSVPLNRENFGIGSKLKKAYKKITKPFIDVASKIVPKEAAGIMQMAAPFVAANPAWGGPWMAALLASAGQAKSRGKINPLTVALSTAPGWGQGRPSGQSYIRDWTQKAPWLDKALFGAPGAGTIGESSMAYLNTPASLASTTTGLLGAGGAYAPLAGSLAGTALGKGAPIETLADVSILKATGWGTGIIAGIQAGKYKDEQEAEEAALLAAKQAGIDAEADLAAIAAEAAALWADWDSTFTPQGGYLAKGGRVGYQFGSTPEEGDIGLEEKIIHSGDISGMDDPGIATYQETVPFEHEGAQAQDQSELMQIAKIVAQLPTPINPYYVWKIMKMAGVGIMEAIEIVKNKMQVGKPFWPTDEEEVYDDDSPNKMFATGGRAGYQLGVGPVGGIGALQPQMQTPMQLPMQTQMQPQLPMQTQMNPQMQTPPPRESGLGRLPIEADMRYTGGFMPYGGTEKADDVPARLSKNEFVFTADAVKAAGGGSVDKGAKKLYDTMKQLEQMA